MANAIYALARQSFLGGSPGINWLTDNIIALLVTSGYTPNLATDQYISIIGGGNIVARSGNLSAKTAINGTANAANVTWPAVSGPTATYVVLAKKDVGGDATSPLILFIDTAINLPNTPNGGDITIQWDSGANKIFTL